MYLDSSDVIELIPEHCKGTPVETAIIPEEKFFELKRERERERAQIAR